MRSPLLYLSCALPITVFVMCAPHYCVCHVRSPFHVLPITVFVMCAPHSTCSPLLYLSCALPIPRALHYCICHVRSPFHDISVKGSKRCYHNQIALVLSAYGWTFWLIQVKIARRLISENLSLQLNFNDHSLWPVIRAGLLHVLQAIGRLYFLCMPQSSGCNHI